MRPPRASREICNAIALASGLLTWAVVVGPAHAGDSGAADEFSYGLAEMLAGRYATGCPALEASYRLDPRPGTLFTLAECNLRQGKTATALADYDQFIALCDRMPPAQQASQAERLAVAKQERASLEAVVPRVTIRVPDSAPLGTIVRCDNKVIAGPVLVGGLPLDPGNHTVGTEVPDGRTGSLTISLEAGDRRSLVAPMPTSFGSPAAPAQALGMTAPPERSGCSLLARQGLSRSPRRRQPTAAATRQGCARLNKLRTQAIRLAPWPTSRPPPWHLRLSGSP